MDINLHIERLVLDGLPIRRSQGALVQAAVEAELAHLLAEGGLASSLQSGGAVPMQLAEEAKPAQIGRQIARAVHRGLKP
jgi:hypothetical protein